MTHLSPSFWVHTTSKCSNKSSCSQTKAPCEKLCFCFEMKILPFSGILSEVRSIVEITKGVQSKILDYKFLKMWTYQPPPCFITYDARQMRHWWGLLQTTLCFPVTAQPDWFMCIPLGQRKTFWQFYTSFLLICNSAIYSGMWEHVNIFQCPLHVMDACQNCVTMDAMAGNQGTKQKFTN